MRLPLFTAFSLVLLLSFLLCSGATAADKINADQLAIQRSMIRYVAHKTARGMGTYMVGDKMASFDRFHKGIEERDGLFVTCADFSFGQDTYDIDYYVKKDGDIFRVVKEVLHKKNDEKLNETLWQDGD